jgi:hypothetical protein
MQTSYDYEPPVVGQDYPSDYFFADWRLWLVLVGLAMTWAIVADLWGRWRRHRAPYEPPSWLE